MGREGWEEAMLGSGGDKSGRKGLRAYVVGYVGVVKVGKRLCWIQGRLYEVVRGCGVSVRVVMWGYVCERFSVVSVRVSACDT